MIAVAVLLVAPAPVSAQTVDFPATCPVQNANGSIQCSASYWCGSTCQAMPSCSAPKTATNCGSCACACPTSFPIDCTASTSPSGNFGCQSGNSSCAGLNRQSVCNAAVPSTGTGQQACGACLGGYQDCDTGAGYDCRAQVNPACPSPKVWDPCASTCRDPYIIDQGGPFTSLPTAQTAEIEITGPITTADTMFANDFCWGPGGAFCVTQGDGGGQWSTNPDGDLYWPTGQIGVGTNPLGAALGPQYPLDVFADGDASGTGDTAILRLVDADLVDELWVGTSLARYEGAAINEKWFIGMTSGAPFSPANQFIIRNEADQNRFVIDQSGNVGVGDFSNLAPTGLLHVRGTSTGLVNVDVQNTSALGATARSAFRASNDAGSIASLQMFGTSFTASGLQLPNWGAVSVNGTAAGLALFTQASGDPIVLGTNNIAAITIDGADQQVGIGESTPGFPLDVRSAASSAVVRINDASGGGTLWTGTQLARAGVEDWFLGMNGTDDTLRMRADGTTDVVTVEKTGRLTATELCFDNGAGGTVCMGGAGGGGGGASAGACLGPFVRGFSAASYNGNRGGYVNANDICDADHPGVGAHVCTVQEILESVQCQAGGIVDDAGNNGLQAWIMHGPPGYTAPAQDCFGWKSAATSSLGRIWNFNATEGGTGYLSTCNQTTFKFACCW